jgi:hypothetical protein
MTRLVQEEQIDDDDFDDFALVPSRWLAEFLPLMLRLLDGMKAYAIAFRKNDDDDDNGDNQPTDMDQLFDT